MGRPLDFASLRSGRAGTRSGGGVSLARARSSFAEQVARGLDAEVKANEPMAPKTSIRVGGSAEVFVRPRSPQSLVELLRLVQSEQVPLSIVGGGANTLVGDLGIPGVTLKIPPDLFGEEVRLSPSGGTVTLGSGASIARLIQLMKSNRLVGAEFLAGIPGSIGGALAMNAGTKMGECMSAVESVEVATADGSGWLPRSKLSYEYRRTVLPALGVVTRVRFVLPVGDLAKSQAQMDADLGYRKSTQPLSQPNFGSVFQNPPADFAGRLIERVGLKGHTIGGAQISALHANWIVNLGGATAKDVVSLIDLARARVLDASGVELKPEVKRIGSFA